MHPALSASPALRDQPGHKRSSLLYLGLAFSLGFLLGLGLAPALAQRPAPSSVMPTEFTSEQAAKAQCGSDTVVWVNHASKVWHVPGDRFYGKTKDGAYMCQTIARAQNYRAATTR